MHTGSTFEEMTALVVAAEENARLKAMPRCGDTRVASGSTGEHDGPCGSLAMFACEEHGLVCEYHVSFCNPTKCLVSRTIYLSWK
jgi:hypothetical protein